MKQFLLFVLFLFLCNQLTEAQQTPTFADPPGPEHVLVLYNSQSDTSLMVMNYYKDARQIPTSNIVALDSLINANIYDSVSNTTHRIILDQQGEIIRDSINQYSSTPSIHAWLYFNERIANPIANHLQTTYVNGTPLKDIIRFIVLCKGVPFRIDARQEDSESYGTNVVCANLLTRLSETIENPYALLEYYNKTPGIDNPYYNADPTFSMEHRFVPNHYQTNLGSATIKLSYLVTHLSAPRFQDIDSMINRSIRAINETNYDWFIDAKQSGPLKVDADNTASNFYGLGIDNYYFETTDQRIMEHEKPVMTYSSDGFWAGFDPDYIQTQLDFDYSDGAFFNTYESHNGLSIGTYPVIRTRGQGLLADFTLMGGTVGVGQAFHSPSSHVLENYKFMPSYAIGYTFIEAAYLGLQKLDATNVVVGDPLTKIFEPVVTTLPNGFVFYPGTYYDHYYVPEGNSVQFSSGGEINFLRNSSLEVDGELVVQQNAVVNFSGFSKLKLKEATFNPGSVVNFYSTLILDGNIFLSENFELKMNGLSNLYITENCQLHFSANSKVKLLNSSKLSAPNLLIKSNDEYIFEDQSSLSVTNLVFENGASFYFNSSKNCEIQESFLIQGTQGITLRNLYVKDFIIYPNSELNFLQGSVVVKNSFSALGDDNNRITVNMNPQCGFSFEGTGVFDIQYCDWQGGTFGLIPNISGNLNASISNSNFFNYGNIFKFVKHQASNFNLYISNSNFSNYPRHGLELSLLDSVLLYNCSFSKISTNPDIGILNDHCNNVKVDNCEFVNISRGIVINIRAEENISLPQIERKFKVSTSQFSNVNIGIEATMEELKTLEIKDNVFIDSRTGILITNFLESTNQLSITNNFIGYRDYGISLTNGNEAIVLANEILSSQNATIQNQLKGIYISQVANPFIINNVITESTGFSQGPGIFSLSSNGQIRRNTITGHLHGIELSGSSPDVALNIITGNKEYGIFAGSTSTPNLGNTSFDEEGYPLTGYNNIYENAGCDLQSFSEIYLSGSYIELSKGCNTIADDRQGPLNCDNTLLIDGDHVGDIIYAEQNYWGNHPVYGNDPTERFGEAIEVNSDGYLEEPCTETPGEAYLFIASSDGTVIDTVFSSGSIQFQQSELQQAYSLADKYFFTNHYSSAVTAYRGITDNYGTTKQSLSAYARLYQLYKLTNVSKEQFADLRSYYSSRLSSISDTSMTLILNHLSDLCLVAEKEYLTAIGNFENVAVNNPNTDLAYYSELNALTTSLLAASDSTMGKISGKYAVNGIDDYYERINKLSQTRRDNSKQQNVEIPKEFSLYQNYPNPFNPSTIIKFGLPEQTEVELTVFDILGRRIKSLVNNEVKQPGYYELHFNASDLASGIYFYQLRTNKFTSTKKMMLVK